MAEAAAPFVWGAGGGKDSISRRRRLAEAMMKAGMDYSPVQHWTQGLSRVAQALVGGYDDYKLDKEEKSNNENLAKSLAAALGGPSTPTTSTAAAPSMAGGTSGARTMAMPNVSPDMKTGIADAATALGISPVDLATTISYETGGTFNPTKAGPTTKWGQHRGLIQFGEPQAKQYGVDWSNPAGSQLGANGAIVAYLRDRGVKPGMGLMDIYSTINAGAPGLYDRSDAAAGGAPGTVADKVNNQMAGHRARAQRMFADAPAPGAAPASMETSQGGFAIPPAPVPVMDANTFNAISEGRPLDPVFQSEGISQPWMGTALQPAAPDQSQMVEAPLPPSRPTDLAIPQADMPAPGAVPAMGQIPQAITPEIDPNSPDAGVRAQIAANAQGGASPFAGIAQALSGGASPQSQPAPTVQGVAQALAPQAASASAPTNPMAALAIALARSGDRDGAVKIATSLLQPTNGVTMGDRLVDPRTGRVIADFSNANGSSKKYGLNPIYGTDKDGKPVMLQAGERGDAVATKLPDGVTLSTGVDKVDAGTHYVLLDKRTGQAVGTIPKDIAGTKVEEAKGTAQGAALTGMTDALAKSQQTLDAIAGIRNHPGRSAWGAQGATAAWPIIGNGMPGTEGRDFVTRVDQLKGQSFLEAFNMLKGGGAISENEGKTATAAIARLDRAQSKEGFDAALDDLEKVIRGGMERARQRAGIGAGGTAPSGSASGWSEVAPGVRIREKR